MVFDVAFLIWRLYQYTVLEPGDLIDTLTSQGVTRSANFPLSVRVRIRRGGGRGPGTPARRRPRRLTEELHGPACAAGARGIKVLILRGQHRASSKDRPHVRNRSGPALARRC
jgi:hypothetical protein